MHNIIIMTTAATDVECNIPMIIIIVILGMFLYNTIGLLVSVQILCAFFCQAYTADTVVNNDND